MIKQISIYTALILAIIILLTFFIRSLHRGQQVTDTGLVLYYSKTCPHCLKVDNFIDSNQVMSRLNLTQKQVDAHLKEITAVAKYCRLNPQSIEIPLLWTGQVCIIGDEPIIQYFKQEMGEK